jgi:hypothetical protein
MWAALINEGGETIGKADVTWKPGRSYNYDHAAIFAVTFTGVNADKITDKLSFPLPVSTA